MRWCISEACSRLSPELWGTAPSDVVGFSAESSAKAEGTDDGLHTARHVSLADVFTSPSRVGLSNSW